MILKSEFEHANSIFSAQHDFNHEKQRWVDYTKTLQNQMLSNQFEHNSQDLRINFKKT